MRPTRIGSLVAYAILAGALGFVVDVSSGSSVVPSTYAVACFALLALAEGYLTGSTRARLRGRAPVQPLVIARLVVLAKASAVLGALTTGWYAGDTAFLLARLGAPLGSPAVRDAALGMAAGLALTVGAVLLERAGRVPHPPEERPGGGGSG